MVDDGWRRAGDNPDRRVRLKRGDYDEDDVRIRPGRSSRPRTRVRPRHDDAVDGFVIAVDRGRYTCAVDGEAILAVRARELGRRGVVVGDRVRLVGDVSGRPDSLARIVRISERSSVLMRTADDDPTGAGNVERVVVANADQLVIVSSLAQPEPRTGFIDRCLVAAYDAGIEPLLCLTKADLAGPDDVLRHYTDLDLPSVLCRPDQPLTPLLSALSGRISVMVGHSGVGKSTLVNRLVTHAGRAVGRVSAVGKGRHTSTSVVALPLPTGESAGGSDPGWIIDTPGIRSFGLAHVSAESLLHGFPDLVEGSTSCPPNCDHTGLDGEGQLMSGCGLDALVAASGASPRRLASYRRLLASRSGDSVPGEAP
jgi:ribosome biogenesis GTPase